MHHGRRVLLVIGIALATAGCGGSGNGTATSGPSSPATATATEASAAGAASVGAATPEAATEVPASNPASNPAANGGGIGGVCDLVTIAELSQAFGRDDIQTTLSPGPPDTCGFTSTDGTALGAIVFLTSDGRAVFDAVHQGSAITDFQGIGDKAFYSTETQTLVVLKGDGLLTVAVVNADTDDAVSATEKAIAEAAAARM